MSQKPISPLLRAWYRWKMLRLPWRRQFLIGLDLNGNTYWEFLDRGSRLPSPNPAHPLTSSVRWRRIVRYPRGTHHGDVQVSPAWHQWLRHTRADPPLLTEQHAEVARQERIKVLAAQADARWEAKPKVMQGSGPSSPAGRAQLGLREPVSGTERDVGPRSKAGEEKTSGTGMTGVTDEHTLGDREAVNRREETWRRMRKEEGETKGKGLDPWKQTRGGPSEVWQPQAWDPRARSKK